MKRSILFLSIMMILSLCTTACSKEEDSTSLTQKKLVGSWLKEKVEKRVNESQWSNVTANCNKDDTEEYLSNGKWTLYPGTNLCNSESVTTGTWSLRTNDTKIIYTYTGFAGEYESSIESISDNSFILTQNTGDVNNTQFRYTYLKLQ